MSNEFVKTIWVSKQDAFGRKVKHLNKILAKHGKPAISFKYTNFRVMEVEFTHHLKGDAFKNDIREKVNVEVCDAVCNGLLEVKKDDVAYTYIGSVNFDAGIKQVFCKDEAYSNFFMDDFRNGWCDHCKTNRTNRKTYHLFSTQDGKVLQIGSKCAKEYFGIDSTAFLETYGQTFFVDYEGCEEDLCMFGRGCITMSYDEIVPFLGYCTNGFLNWVKASEYSDPKAPIWQNPTVAGVRDLINASPAELDSICFDKNARNTNLTLEECVAYWEKRNDGSTFAYNALQTLRAGYATDKSLGAFCYAVFAAYNAKVRALKEAAAAAKTYAPCRWEKGKRADIKGVIVNIREFETLNEYKANMYNGYYGTEETRYSVDFQDEVGTLYHFVTGGGSFPGVKNGMKVSIRGTIGETNLFKGVPYTRLSRPVCTVQKEDGESAVA